MLEVSFDFQFLLFFFFFFFAFSFSVRSQAWVSLHMLFRGGTRFFFFFFLLSCICYFFFFPLSKLISNWRGILSRIKINICENDSNFSRPCRKHRGRRLQKRR